MDLDPEARRILDLTREGRTPSPHDKARIERLLGGAVGFAALPALASTSVAPGAKATAAALAVKWGVVAVLVASTVGGAGYLFERSARSPAARAVPSPMAVEAPRSVIENGPQVPAAAVATVAPDPAEVAQPVRALVAAPRSRETRRRGEGTLGAELDLLHEVQAKWRGGDASGALSLLAVHRERYPRSELGPEREALRVLCLCATGRVDEARRIGRRFLASAPRSPLRTSVEESCAGK